RGAGTDAWSYAFDGVALAARRFELALQQLAGASLVGDHLSYARRHPILDSCDLTGNLRDIRAVVAAVALALAPQPRVLIAKFRHRAPDPAVEAQLVLSLRAGHLLAAVAAEHEDRAHAVFRSATTAPLSSRNRSGAISNTESGRPAAAHACRVWRGARALRELLDRDAQARIRQPGLESTHGKEHTGT